MKNFTKTEREFLIREWEEKVGKTPASGQDEIELYQSVTEKLKSIETEEDQDPFFTLEFPGYKGSTAEVRMKIIQPFGGKELQSFINMMARDCGMVFMHEYQIKRIEEKGDSNLQRFFDLISKIQKAFMKDVSPKWRADMLRKTIDYAYQYFTGKDEKYISAIEDLLNESLEDFRYREL